MKNISILGVTGSIGTQALDVIRNSKEDINVIGVTANKSVNMMKEIILEFSPKYIGMMDKTAFEEIKSFVETEKINAEVLFGMEGLKKIASLNEIEIVLTSIVGMIGLEPTLEAIRAGKDIALANKETLVVAGELVMKEAKEYGVKILPVDSEHSAIFQSLRGNNIKEVNKLIITASGGPFRGKNIEDLRKTTVREALNHPKWKMGSKITIDSATLMNKGLEVIEAHFLFNVSYDDIMVVVHPESIVHSMVEYRDNSVIAQLGAPDMRIPIQYAFNYPCRVEPIANRLNIYEIGALHFEKPDMDTFKCLKLAYEVGKKGKLYPTVLNGANEKAVELFLNEKIKFLDIPNAIEDALINFEDECGEEITLEKIISLDKRVKEFVEQKWS